MYQINYFGQGEVSEYEKWKANFKHGDKVSSCKVNVEETQKQIYLEA